MKKFWALIILALIGIQFIPVERTNPPVTTEIYTSDKVKAILKKSCYDCHSNETNWSWYTKIAPISFITIKDVNEGRKHLNFSEWDKHWSNEANVKKEIWEEIESEKMPPWIFRILRSDGILTQEEKNIIRNWAKAD